MPLQFNVTWTRNHGTITFTRSDATSGNVTWTGMQRGNAPPVHSANGFYELSGVSGSSAIIQITFSGRPMTLTDSQKQAGTSSYVTLRGRATVDQNGNVTSVAGGSLVALDGLGDPGDIWVASASEGEEDALGKKAAY